MGDQDTKLRGHSIRGCRGCPQVYDPNSMATNGGNVLSEPKDIAYDALRERDQTIVVVVKSIGSHLISCWSEEMKGFMPITVHGPLPDNSLLD